MKLIRITVIVSVCCCALSTLFADTIPGGDVSGTWVADSSPYYIAGNITVASNDTLLIEPGVEVSFLGYHAMYVNGFLEAVGTEADSIWFAGGWLGFFFNGAPG
ncbi:hypothetical protein JXB22_01700, partial [candidate division WOR-3 bacterium]|nr:hypothetical protein [candidate division WOR-3 bacterium]